MFASQVLELAEAAPRPPPPVGLFCCEARLAIDDFEWVDDSSSLPLLLLLLLLLLIMSSVVDDRLAERD